MKAGGNKVKGKLGTLRKRESLRLRNCKRKWAVRGRRANSLDCCGELGSFETGGESVNDRCAFFDSVSLLKHLNSVT